MHVCLASNALLGLGLTQTLFDMYHHNSLFPLTHPLICHSACHSAQGRAASPLPPSAAEPGHAAAGSPARMARMRL